MQNEIINSTAGAAAILGISLSHLYKLMAQKKITYYKPGGKKAKFLRSDLEAYLLRNRVINVEEAEASIPMGGRRK